MQVVTRGNTKVTRFSKLGHFFFFFFTNAANCSQIYEILFSSAVVMQHLFALSLLRIIINCGRVRKAPLLGPRKWSVNLSRKSRSVYYLRATPFKCKRSSGCKDVYLFIFCFIGKQDFSVVLLQFFPLELNPPACVWRDQKSGFLWRWSAWVLMSDWFHAGSWDLVTLN